MIYIMNHVAGYDLSRLVRIRLRSCVGELCKQYWWRYKNGTSARNIAHFQQIDVAELIIFVISELEAGPKAQKNSFYFLNVVCFLSVSFPAYMQQLYFLHDTDVSRNMSTIQRKFENKKNEKNQCVCVCVCVIILCDTSL